MMFFKPLIFYLLTALPGIVIAWLLPYAESYWLVLAILAGFYLANTQIIPQINSRFICAGFLIAILASGSGLLADKRYALDAFLLLTMLISVALGVWQPRLWRIVFISNYLVMIGAALAIDTTAATQRYFYAATGFMLVAGLCWIMFHNTSARQLKWFFANCLLKAAVLSETIFTIYQARDYQQRIFFYEKKLHWQRNAFLLSLTSVRNALGRFNKARSASFNQLLQYVEEVYEILLAMGLLSYRVTDHHTFEVANKEIVALGEGVTVYLQALAVQLRKGRLVVPPNFVDSIQDFQDISNDALLVVAPDPMVFILFMQQFYALHEIFTQMIEVIDKV